MSIKSLGRRIACSAFFFVCTASAQTFWKQASAHAGARVCAGCHRDVYAKQEATHHARSLRPPAEIEELMKPLPFRYLDRSSQAELTLRRNASGLLELEAVKQQESHRLPLEWGFGSGVKGITPLGRRADGRIVESRLTWYAGTRGIGLTTGATRRDPQTAVESLGRTLSKDEVRECFSCHTTNFAPGSPAPAREEMGIRCERCHGPGLQHARHGRAREIFHPGRVEAFSQVSMCGACHGKPPRDSDLQAIRFIEQNPNTARFPSQRLVLSRCYNESADNLKCTHCHDPHTDGLVARQQRDASCVGCHSKGSRLAASLCPKATSGCVSCHMPREKVMVHSEFTDHWIRVVRVGG